VVELHEQATGFLIAVLLFLWLSNIAGLNRSYIT